MRIKESRLPDQNPRYGDVLVRCGIEDEDQSHSFVVSVLEHRGETWLDIRSLYEKSGLRFGKGVRIPMSLAGEVFRVVGRLADAWEGWVEEE